MVAILKKSDAAEGFEQIIDFLSGSYINYALTVNPHVYISCIKQFWNTAVVKRSCDVTRLQALVDKKRIVITKEVVHEILQLNDAEGVICLPNEEIFAGLARMGYEKPSTKLTFYKAFFSTQWKFFIYTILHSLSAKRTSWNEFSSAMASALICLSSGQRFNFSKVGKGFSGVETPLFENMLAVSDVAKEAEAQVPAQGDDVQEPAAEEVATDVVPPTPTSPSPSSPRVLDTCSALALRVEGLENDKAAQQLEIVKLKARVKKLEKINKVKSSKLRRLKKFGSSQHVKSSDDVENVFNQGRIIVDMDQDEGIELVTVQEKDAEVAAASTPIPAAKPKTLTITAAPAVSTRRRKGVVIRDPEEELSSDTPAETSKGDDVQEHPAEEVVTEVVPPTPTPPSPPSPGRIIVDIDQDEGIELVVDQEKDAEVVAAGTPIPTAKPKILNIIAAPAEEINKEHEEAYKNIDWNAALDHVQSKEPQYIKRYHRMKKKPQTESEARKNMIFYLKNTKGYKMDFFKGMTYDEILPIFKAKFKANMRFLFKSREEMEAEDEEIIKSINETPAQKETKRRKLSKEAQEADDLRKRLEIVQDKDDDVFVKATPLAQTVHVVDYQIVVIDNKPKYKIIRADDTRQFYINFTTLLKNFDREDLETL
nr:hypothetical protein [Tanacetum cinerariifolium]